MGRYHALQDTGEPPRAELAGAYQVIVTKAGGTQLVVKLINGPFGDQSSHIVRDWPLKQPPVAAGDRGVALFDETEEPHIVSWRLPGWGESQSHPLGDTRP